MSAGTGVLDGEFGIDAGCSMRVKSLELLAVALAFLACGAAPMLIERSTLRSEVAALGELHSALERMLHSAQRVGARDAGPEAPKSAEKPSSGRATNAPGSGEFLSSSADSEAPAWNGVPPRALASNHEPAVQLAPGAAVLIADLRARRRSIERDIERHSDAAFALMLVVNFIALATLTVLVLLFVRRLAADLEVLTRRARDIGRGDLQGSHGIERRDEVGQLAHALDTMRGAWAAWQNAAELRCRRQAYRDMLDAFGALAQKAVHEIGNPLAGIVGVAQSIHDAKHVRSCRSSGEACHPEVILHQAERIASTSRQFCDWSDLQRGEPGASNINELIERTCGLLAYDRRVTGIRIRTSLAPALPAVDAAADAVVQLLSWIVFDASKRIGASPGASGLIEVGTGQDERGVRMEIADNGVAPACTGASCVAHCQPGAPGMHALCRLLVDEMGGRFESVCASGVNCTRIWLPPSSTSSPGARG